MKKRKKRRTSSPIQKDLRTPKYKPKTIPHKKKRKLYEVHLKEGSEK